MDKISIDDPNLMPSKYNYESTIGVTLGAQSLHMQHVGPGIENNLAFALDGAQRAEFMANSFFSMDITVPATTETEDNFSQIYNVIINAEGYGWHGQLESPLGLTSAGLDMNTTKLVIDYRDAKKAMPASPSHVAIIISTNNGGVRTDYYFDNAALYGGVSNPCATSQADINGDCVVNMADFAVIASSWMICNDPASFGSDPDCNATW